MQLHLKFTETNIVVSDLCHRNTQEAVAGGSQIAEKQIVRFMHRLVYKPIIPALEQKLETEPPGV